MENALSWKTIAPENQLYSFSGYITNRVLDGIAAGIEDVLAARNETKNSYRKIFGIFVEMAQNIIFYAPDRVEIPNDEAGFGTISILNDEEFVRIHASNEVLPHQKEHLEKIFDQIEQQSPDEIGKLYKQRMLETFDDPNSRGGGLGYYDIARKSSRPIEYVFETLENGKVVFHVSAWI